MSSRAFDLREWLQAVESASELCVVEGANWQEEIGVITELNAKRSAPRALLFDDIPGSTRGFRVLSGALISPYRMAMTLGLEASTTAELIATLRNGRMRKWEERAPEFEPTWTADGPVMENVQTGAAIDLDTFPTPLWHKLDGGRYIGSGCAVITKDPDTGWVNAGAYRCMVTGRDSVSLWMATRRHGRVHMQKYWDRGEPCPIVIVVGGDPLLTLLAGLEVGEGTSELAMAGSVLGAPVPCIRGPITGLPIPATAEIVLEGWCYPDDLVAEGPHGEGTGYYAGGVHKVPRVQLAGVYYRNNPILFGMPPGKPPHDFSYTVSVARAALIHDQVEATGIPGITGIWSDYSRQLLVVAVKQLYHGHARQAAMAATHVPAAAYLGRYTIVVDDDVDPSDLQDVVWAMVSRSNPGTDITVLDRCWGSPIDPLKMTYPEGTMLSTRAVIDACRPYEHFASFPPVAASDPEDVEKVRQKWGAILQ